MNIDKAIDRAAKLRAQMRSEAELGNEAAAQAFGAMMSRLMVEHDINEARVVTHQEAGIRKPDEPVVEHHMDLSKLGIEYRSSRNVALEDLMSMVGRAHLCKTLVRSRSNLQVFVGTQAHVDVAVYMVETMWRTMNQLQRAGRRVARREKVDLQGYGPAFRVAFLQGVRKRYQVEREAIVNETATNDIPNPVAGGEASLCTGLAVINRAMARVDDYISKRYKTRMRGTRYGSSRGNARGSADGNAAASRVGTRASGIGGGTARAALTA